MNKKHALSALAILVLLAGVGWAVFSGEDAAFLEAKKQRDEMFEKMDTLTPEQRRAEFDSLREKTVNFSEAQRRALREGGRRFMMQKVDNLLAMPEAERNAELDLWIDRMEEGRKSGAGRGGPGGPGRGGPPGGDGKPRGGGADRGKARLDRSTPEMRAKMDAMKDLINERRKERGMEPMKGGGRFGRGGR